MPCSDLLADCQLFEISQLFCRTPGETPQARPAGLNVFTTALRCVPYIMPEHWAGSRLMDDLPGALLSPLPLLCLGQNAAATPMTQVPCISMQRSCSLSMAAKILHE